MEPVRHTAKLTNLTRACLTVQVLLLERGAVREHGAPLELLSRPDGAFRSLAEESGVMPGLVQAAREAAAEAAQARAAE